MQSSDVPALIPGTRYTLIKSILSVYPSGDRHVLEFIPAGAEVLVKGEELGARFLEIEWDSKLTKVFIVDLIERAEEQSTLTFGLGKLRLPAICLLS